MEDYFGEEWKTSSILEFLKVYLGTDIKSLSDVLRGMHAIKGSPVRWTEMGGGMAMAMRELAPLRSFVDMTNVDLIKTQTEETCGEFKKAVLEHIGIDVDDESLIPEFKIADITDVQLPYTSDLITCIEAVQYLDDPLEAFCNWYNQLADGCVLIVSSDHRLNNWIRNYPPTHEEGVNILSSFLESLKASGIDIVAYNKNTHFRYNPVEFTRFLIVKKPGTSIRPNIQVKKVSANIYSYKACYYDVEALGDEPLFEVVSS